MVRCGQSLIVDRWVAVRMKEHGSAVMTNEKKRKEKRHESISKYQCPGLPSNQTGPSPMPAIALYSYGHFFPMTYLFPVLRAPQALVRSWH